MMTPFSLFHQIGDTTGAGGPYRASSAATAAEGRDMRRVRRRTRPPLRRGGASFGWVAGGVVSWSCRAVLFERGGRPVPSVVGCDSRRGTRHAAGSPPHTAALTARWERHEELWIEG